MEQEKNLTKLDLSIGTKVEVSSEEEGFKGAWYEATIVEPPSSKTRRRGNALVQYQSLLSEDGHNPLVEVVDGSFIRPMPPGILEKETPFDVFEVVDAFYRDGWWKGVVTKVLEDDKSKSWRYVVVFDDPPDQMVFRSLNLRHHWDWTNGKWVRPEKQQRMKGLSFSKGMSVEVNLDKGKPKHVWLPAYIMEEVGFNSFLVSVKCKSSGDNNESKKKVSVDCFHIRPPPPCFEVKDLEPLEKVHAFYDLAWRNGFVTRILPEGVYIVYLMDEKQEKQFMNSEVRPHLEFIAGKWVGYCKRGLASIKAKKLKKDNDGPESSIPEKGQEEVESPHSDSAKNTLKRLRNAEHAGSEIKDTSPTPLKKLKLKFIEGHSSNPPLSLDHEKLTPVEAPNDEGQFTNCVQTECSGQPVVDNQHFTESETPCRGKDADNHQEDGLENEIIKSAEKTGAQQKSQISAEEVLMLGSEDNGKGNLSTSLVEGMKELLPEEFCQLNQEETIRDAEWEGEITCVEKRGTLPSTQIEGQQNLTQVQYDYAKGNSAEDTAVFDQITNGTDLSSSAQGIRELPAERPHLLDLEEMNQQEEYVTSQKQNDGEERNVAGSNISEMDFESYENEVESLITKIVDSAGLQSISAETSNLLPSTDFTMEEVGIPLTVNSSVGQGGTVVQSLVMSVPVEKETVGLVSCGASINDQPQTSCLEGISLDGTENHCNVTIERQCEAFVQSSVVENELVKNEGWPFVKFSSLWEKVESLEVFQFMPQKPHFHPLAKCREVRREGSAIGHMVTFASLVEMISKLQVTDPRSHFDGYLEDLAELETLGFDVKALVDRINQLLSTQDRQRELENQSKEVQIEIADHILEKDKIECNIAQIDEEIKALKTEREKYILLKERKACDISAMELQAGVINEGISAAKCDFRDLVAAVWKMP